MIVLDTNVISELIKDRPHARVLNWVNEQAADDLAITSITVAEILYGIARLPEGSRKARLQSAGVSMLDEFEGAVLPFDGDCAAIYARRVAQCHSQGYATQIADAQIAAICANNEALLATRNTKDFIHFQIELINPWED